MTYNFRSKAKSSCISELRPIKACQTDGSVEREVGPKWELSVGTLRQPKKV